MANPPPVKKKSGMGCCGCGCIILALIALLLLGLVGGGGYMAYTSALKITTATPDAIPTFDGGEDVYNRAEQKLKAFEHDAKNNLAATIHLTADEINTLIARNPNFSRNKIMLFVTLTGDEARLQTSIPSGIISSGLLKGRYLNGDVSFGANFDPETKKLSFDLKNLRVGPLETPVDDLPAIQAQTDPAINKLLQEDPDFKAIINSASSIEIKDNELVIETK